ncbi:MAG: SCO family protein [Salibacteraceae bacterium]
MIYVILATGKEKFAVLPVYGKRVPTYETTAEGDTLVDTIYHSIPEFAFVNQDNQPVDRSTMEGRICVSNFIFTNCQTICPAMSESMAQVQHRFVERQDKVAFYSFTIDPANDTPEVLARYAIRLKAKHPQWQFLTGDQQEIFKLAAQGFLIQAEKGDGGAEQFFHSNRLVLTDTEGRIRGMYDGTDASAVVRLTEDIRALEFDAYLSKKNRKKKI